MHLYSTTVYFVVLSSVFSCTKGCAPRLCYDLKGSSVSRFVKGDKATLKDENLRREGLRTERVRRDASKVEPLPLRIDAPQHKELMAQLQADTQFLAQQLGVMDYSLLLGVFAPGDAAETPPAGRTPAERLSLLHGGLGQQPRDLVIGLIDVVQVWNLSKSAEAWAKTLLLCKDKRKISAVPADLYQERFMAFLRDELFSPCSGDGIRHE